MLAENGVDGFLFDQRDVAPGAGPARKTSYAGKVTISLDSALGYEQRLLDTDRRGAGAIRNKDGCESSVWHMEHDTEYLDPSLWHRREGVSRK